MTWQRTPAFYRALTCGLVAFVLAVVTKNPGVFLLGLPLLVVGLWELLWSLAEPERGAPHVTVSIVGATGSGIESDEAFGSVNGVLRREEGDTVEVRWAARSLPPDGAVVLEPSSALVRSQSPNPASMHLGQRATVAATLDLDRFGRHELAAGRATAISPWGGHAVTFAIPSAEVIVLPSALGGRVMPATRGLRGGIGVHDSRKIGPGTQMSEIRDYRHGDDSRRIHWPATARVGSVQMIDTERDVDVDLWIVADMPVVTEDLPNDQHARIVRTSLGLAATALRGGDRVGLMVLGCGAVDPIQPAAGVRQRVRLRECLAQAQPRDNDAINQLQNRALTQLQWAGNPVVIYVTPSPHRPPTALLTHTRARSLVTALVTCADAPDSSDPPRGVMAIDGRRDDVVTHTLRVVSAATRRRR